MVVHKGGFTSNFAYVCLQGGGGGGGKNCERDAYVILYANVPQTVNINKI